MFTKQIISLILQILRQSTTLQAQQEIFEKKYTKKGKNGCHTDLLNP